MAIDSATIDAPAELWLSTTHQLAEAALAGGELRWASRAFHRAHRNDGNPQEYIVRGLSGLGWCQLQANEPEKSAATFDRLLEKYPDSQAAAEAAWARGQALERLKQFDAALASYQLIVDKQPIEHRDMSTRCWPPPDCTINCIKPIQAIELYHTILGEHASSPQDRRRPITASAGRCATPAAGPNRISNFKKFTTIFATSHFWNDATFRLAESAVADKQFDRASKLLAELLAAQPPTEMLPHVIYLQGELAAGRQKWDEVEARMDQVAHDFASSPIGIARRILGRGSRLSARKIRRSGQAVGGACRARSRGRNDAWLAMVPLRRAQVYGTTAAMGRRPGDRLADSARLPDFRPAI